MRLKIQIILLQTDDAIDDKIYTEKKKNADKSNAYHNFWYEFSFKVISLKCKGRPDFLMKI